MTFLHTIQQFIDHHQLLDHSQVNIVAVSGGADSVCLMLVLKRLGYSIEVAHCNFKLRGDESDRDELFVRNLCKTNNIPIHVIHFDTTTYAKTHQIGIEMAARQLRYNYFQQLRNDIGASKICVAHHRDDSVETILMNLIRGTGIDGLTGIKPVNGHVVRPLLAVSRQEIEVFLKEEGQDYVTDSTNSVPNIMRNLLRQEIIPRIATLSPTVSQNIMDSAQHLAATAHVYHKAVDDTLRAISTDDSMDIEALLQEPEPECVLYEWLRPKGFSPATIDNICSQLYHPRTGSHWDTDTHMVFIHGTQLAISLLSSNDKELIMPETGLYNYDDSLKLRLTKVEGTHIDRSPAVACLDADKVDFPLTLRHIRQGDRFKPFGMKGSKLVSDYLANIKMPLNKRQRQMVVTNASGEIIWLAGLRPDGRFTITDSTRCTLTATLISQ